MSVNESLSPLIKNNRWNRQPAEIAALLHIDQCPTKHLIFDGGIGGLFFFTDGGMQLVKVGKVPLENTMVSVLVYGRNVFDVKVRYKSSIVQISLCVHEEVASLHKLADNLAPSTPRLFEPRIAQFLDDLLKEVVSNRSLDDLDILSQLQDELSARLFNIWSLAIRGGLRITSVEHQLESGVEDEIEHVSSHQNPNLPYIILSTGNNTTIIPLDSKVIFFGYSKNEQNLEQVLRKYRFITDDNYLNNRAICLPEVKAPRTAVPSIRIEINASGVFLFNNWGNWQPEKDIRIRLPSRTTDAFLKSSIKLTGFEMIFLLSQINLELTFIPRMDPLSYFPSSQEARMLERIGLWGSAAYAWIALKQQENAYQAIRKAVQGALDPSLKIKLSRVADALYSDKQ